MRNAFHLPQPAQCLSRDKQSVLTVSRTNLLPGCCLLLGASASLQPDTISGWVALLLLPFPLASLTLFAYVWHISTGLHALFCSLTPHACALNFEFV